MSKKVMTLNVGNERLIKNPTDQQIRAEIEALDLESFAILGTEDNEMVYMQTAGDRVNGFDLEFQEGSLEDHYRASDISLDQVVEAFIDYRDGRDDWQTRFSFERLRL